MSYSPPDLELRAHIRHRVACGFDDARMVVERIAYQHDDVDEAILDALVVEMFAERDTAARGWPVRTDCDRLDDAFRELERTGIVARHNFACCQTCGTHEIGDEIAAAREARRSVDGYVFYHWQDTDRVVTSGELHLRYGGTLGTDDAAVGRRIVTALRDAGLEPTWTGDPTSTIQLTLDWKRRHPPILAAEGRSADDCVAWWCAALPRATRSSAAAKAGRDMPRALDAVGLADAALAWASAPFYDGDRAVSRARLAVQRRSPDLLLQAWTDAPWDRRGTFVRLLVEAGLDDPRVFAIARDKIDESRQDASGGAAAAWFYARTPGFEPARQRAEEQWRRDSYPDNHVLALGAGLWRAGVGGARDRVVAAFETSFETWSRDAAIAGAPTVEDVLELAPRVPLFLASDGLLRICDRLCELGAIDAARKFATTTNEACVAYVAWRTGDAESIARIRDRFAEHEQQYEDGLLSKDDLRDIRIAVGVASGDRALLAEVAARACDDTLAEYRSEALEILDGNLPAIEAPPERKLAIELATWPTRIAKRITPQQRRSVKLVLRAVTYHARHGAVERARELYDRVVDMFGEDEDALARGAFFDELVAATVALGDLERVERMSADWPLSALAIGCYAPALAANGERERAVALVDARLATVETRRELLELLPAIVALASDLQVVRAAFATSDAALDALRVT